MQLLTGELRQQIPKLYSQEEKELKDTFVYWGLRFFRWKINTNILLQNRFLW